MLSNENILSSKTYFTFEIEEAKSLVNTWTGGKLLITDRFAQTHVILFIVVMFILLCMLSFHYLLKKLFQQFGFF